MKRILLLCIVLLSGFYLEVMAQSRTITGKVTSEEDGSAIPGVSVVLKGSTTGTVTDIDGRYSISTPEEGGVLQFSFVGLLSQEVEIGNQSVINVSLASDVRQLNEIVVTALGMEKESRTLGYASSTIDNQEITHARPTSAIGALQGKVAGLSIASNSGAPGASSRVVIRGLQSVTGDNSPLYIIDGVPIDNTSSNFYVGGNTASRTQDFGNRANDINPDDVESITVLKGASATALYGSRAANGVIMITTKKGKSGKLAIDYSGNVDFTEPLRLPQLQGNFGQGWSGHFAFDENGSWGPKLDSKDVYPWGNVVDGEQQYKPFTNQKDNLKDFYETGVAYNNSISLSGGNDKTTFFLSYANLTQDGFIPTDADKLVRNSLGFRGSTEIGKLKLSTSISYVNKDLSAVSAGQGTSDGGATLFQELIQIPRDHAIVDYKDYNGQFNNTDNFYTPYADNPYFVLNENGNEFKDDRIYGSVSATYQLADWLSATARIGGDVANNTIQAWGAIAKTTPGSPNNNGGRSDVIGRVDEFSRHTHEYDGNFLLNSSKTFGDISASLTLGYNVNERYYREVHAYVSDLVLPNYYNLKNAKSNPTGETITEHRRYYGVLGQAEIGYKEYLYLTVSARNDWSSTLPKENNNFFYPGANLSFIVTDAVPSLQTPVLSFAKLRAGWGKTGKDADPYLINSVIIPGEILLPFGQINFPIGGVNAYERSNRIGNQNLKPELTSEYEFGADLRFLDSRLNIDFAYYDRTTDGLIFDVTLPPSTGYTTQIKNVGKINNKGIELSLNATPLRLGAFEWKLGAIYSRNRNKVLDITEDLGEEFLITGAYSIDFVATEGRPIGVYKGPVPKYSPDGKIIVNAQGIPVIDPEKGEYGTSQPDYVLGLNTTLSYKGLSLFALFDIKQGGQFYSYTSQLTYFVGNATKSTFNERQPFLVPNSVQEVTSGDEVAYVENTTPITMGNINSYWYSNSNNTMYRNSVLDASYVKFRELSLSYTLPANIIETLPFTGVQLGVYGRNLLLWTPEENNFIDPEVTTWGTGVRGQFGEFASGPSARTFGFKLGLQF